MMISQAWHGPLFTTVDWYLDYSHDSMKLWTWIDCSSRATAGFRGAFWTSGSIPAICTDPCHLAHPGWLLLLQLLVWHGPFSLADIFLFSFSISFCKRAPLDCLMFDTFTKLVSTTPYKVLLSENSGDWRMGLECWRIRFWPSYQTSTLKAR
jgi:hypothetical protein